MDVSFYNLNTKMLKMKTALHPTAALVSAEELQGLLGSAPAPGGAGGRPSGGSGALGTLGVWGFPAGLVVLALLGVFQASLLLALTRLPLPVESWQGALGAYIGVRLGLELLVLGLWALGGTSATLQRWRPVLLTVALTTLGLDLLAWASFGL